MRIDHFLVVVLIISIVSLAAAQSKVSLPALDSNAKLSGLIVDEGDARIAAAEIVIEGKGFRRVLTSNNDGSYSVQIPQGKYKVVVQRSGFYVRTITVKLKTNESKRLDVRLKGIRVDGSHP